MNAEPLNSRDLQTIERGLETAVRLLGILVADRRETIREKAVALAAAGLSPKIIASICDSNPHSVSQQLSLGRKKRPARPRKKPLGGRD